MAKIKTSKSKTITISGIVEELALDDDDIALQIVDSGRIYRVTMDNQGRKLLDYVDETIEATGFIIKSKGGSEIQIVRFHLADEVDSDKAEIEEDDWSMDDDDDFLNDRYDQ